MSIVVFAAYCGAALLALALVYLFHARWYWHAFSVLAALALGFAPPVPGWDGPSRDLFYGLVILFLFIWGVAEPFLHRFHRQGLRHA